MSDFFSEYKERIKCIDSYMEKRFGEFKNCEDVIYDAMHYSVFNGGKRIRSVLCVETARMLGADEDVALPFAMGIELIHAFSLVHDDLPCMDNADTRRSQPSCHKKFGETMALLAGDALLNTAYEIMAAECAKNAKAALAMQHIAKSAGVNGMINGQVRDLELAENGNADESKLIALIEQKTMALIMTGVMSGAYIAGADEKTLKKLEEFAYCIGMAFQIRDDFEDEEEDKNSEHAVPNFINVLGRSKALEKMNYYSGKAIEIIDAFENNGFIKGLVEYLF